MQVSRAPIAGELIVWFPRMKACISSRVRRPSLLACIVLKLFPRAAASHRERFRSLSRSGGERREVVHTLGVALLRWVTDRPADLPCARCVLYPFALEIYLGKTQIVLRRPPLWGLGPGSDRPHS